MIPELTLCEIAQPNVPGLESYSPFCVKVHRALKTLGLFYTREHGMKPSSFSSINPQKQVPVLLMDGEPVADSTRILERLERLGIGTLLPADPAKRGEAYLWEDYGDGVLTSFVSAARFADPENWPRVRKEFFAKVPWLVRLFLPTVVRRKFVRRLIERDIWRAGRQACWLRFQATLNALEARAPEIGMWLGGEQVTTADISLFAPLHVLRNHLTPWQAEQIARRPRLAAYLDRVQARTFETAIAVTPPERTERRLIAV
jgi:glutathione S-transferase